jgi:hypothetical protein
MTKYGCGCAHCQFAPTTLRRLRCQRPPPNAPRAPDLHTAAHVEWELKLLPSKPPPVQTAEFEVATLPPLRRIGTELRWMAIFALLSLLVAAYWPVDTPTSVVRAPCAQPCVMQPSACCS